MEKNYGNVYVIIEFLLLEKNPGYAHDLYLCEQIHFLINFVSSVFSILWYLHQAQHLSSKTTKSRTFFLSLLKYTRNNISISTLTQHVGNSENCEDFTVDFDRLSIPTWTLLLCYNIAATDLASKIYHPVPFLQTRTYRFTLHIRFLLTTQRHASQTGSFTREHFFPSPRMFYKCRCARDGSSGTCRKETDGRRLRANRRSSYSGRAIAWRAAGSQRLFYG